MVCNDWSTVRGLRCGAKASGKPKQHGVEYRRKWRKAHIGIDAETLEIRAIEVTSNVEGDAQILPDLIEQIPEDEVLVFVHDDGTYDTKAFYAAITQRNAAAIIPTQKNEQPWQENKSDAGEKRDGARHEVLRQKAMEKRELLSSAELG